mmetsp:Transcript_62314/g.140399  ORF Transcript_62314/g.140399 Transcript_62314/m.140399 type:complete len:629 (-) Transcript_62314:83-1969(-)
MSLAVDLSSVDVAVEGSSADVGKSFKVAFQGEKGAYSEQALFELLGKDRITSVPFASFDLAFGAATSGEVDLLNVPIENSLGGTIHANFDLQLQHSLFIIAEHDFRVRHCLMALPGTKKTDLKKIISHTQALAQCDSYIKRLGVPGEAAYDTAGSAKMILEGKLEGVGAICSELAADYYGLEILDRGIEDDSNNFTRFLLLRRDPVRIPAGIKCKTSIVFSLQNNAGALFKALSVFALRDIDLSKIESRPCKPDVMDRLERLFWSMSGCWRTGGQLPAVAGGVEPQTGRPSDGTEAGRAQYKYIFYADFLAPADEPNSANAIRHLQEMTTYFRILGTYPRGGTLVGLDNLGPQLPLPSAGPRSSRKQRVGIVGFGNFGEFMAKKLITDFQVFATAIEDRSEAAASAGVTWCETIQELVEQRLDVLVIAVSILSFEGVVRKVAKCMASSEAPGARGVLVVDVLSVKVHAKTTMLALLPEACDVLCTHPMFGPQSGKHGWGGLPFVFERVRLREARRCEEFLKWWGTQGCRMIDMTCELHDEVAAGSQFVTHFTGRVLARLGLQTTPINTKGFDSLLQLVENTCKDSFDLFFALYKFNPNSAQQLQSLEEAIADVTQDLRSDSRLSGTEA